MVRRLSLLTAALALPTMLGACAEAPVEADGEHAIADISVRPQLVTPLVEAEVDPHFAARLERVEEIWAEVGQMTVRDYNQGDRVMSRVPDVGPIAVAGDRTTPERFATMAIPLERELLLELEITGFTATTEEGEMPLRIDRPIFAVDTLCAQNEAGGTPHIDLDFDLDGDLAETSGAWRVVEMNATIRNGGVCGSTTGVASNSR